MQNLTRLQFFDKYLGSLICFIFSLINKFNPKKRVKSIKNVLVIELFEIGAAIMAHSSINYIKIKLKNPSIYCLCLNGGKESWRLLNLIPNENILTINGKNLFSFIRTLIKQIMFLRKRNLDLIIDFELFTRISSIISFLIKSKLKAGFYRYKLEGLYRGNFYNINCSYNQNTHISKNLLALTKTAINQVNNYPNYKSETKDSEIIIPTYKSNLKLKKKIKEKIKLAYHNYNNNHLILICPDVGKKLSIRNYPKSYFVELINKLLSSYPNYLILLIGLKESLLTCSYITNQVNNKRCIDFHNQTSTLKELLELMNLSRLLIANDSGPIHLASSTQIKTLALFGPETPFVYGPLGKSVALYAFFHCSPCISALNNKRAVCKDNLCLKSIKPMEVFDYSVKLINNELKFGVINKGIPYNKNS